MFVDEAAFYENVCRRVGVNAINVDKSFANDPSPAASVVKVLWRATPAEFRQKRGIVRSSASTARGICHARLPKQNDYGVSTMKGAVTSLAMLGFDGADGLQLRSVRRLRR